LLLFIRFEQTMNTAAVCRKGAKSVLKENRTLVGYHR